MSELRAVIDYETRSAGNLKVLSAADYAKHPSTSVFCVGYKINNGPRKLWIPERAPMPPDLWECFQHGILVAHNAGFERAITRWVLTRYPLLTSEQRFKLASLKPSQWRCTAAKVAACSLPRSLDMAGAVLELPTRKDKRGHKLILKYSKPRKPSKKDPSLWWHDKQDLRDIYSYCLTDVQVEWELDQALPDLSDAEQRVWELDQVINDRGILIDIPIVKLILSMIHKEIADAQAQVRKLSHDTIDSATQTARVLAWLNARGAGMANLQAQTIRDKLEDTELDPLIKRMLTCRQTASRTSTAKYLKMIQVVGDDNRARELLLYCGTMPTARWAGKRLQPHNFPKPTLYPFNMDEAIELIKQGIKAVRKHYGRDKVMDVLVSAIRGMLIASPGHELFCADFSAVELGITFWVAGHTDGIQAIRDGRKLYEEMASAAFGIPLEEVDKDSLERFVGKESVLGCGFGMGHRKFLGQCHKKGMKTVTPEIAKKAVYTYRAVHWPVPELWANLERAAIEAIAKPGRRVKTNRVTVYVKGDFLNIKLPSGRRLRYFKPRLSSKRLAGGRLVPQIHYWTVDSYTRQWVEVTIWGGVFTNHVVQGIARDLMVSGIFNIEEAGYQFILSVHDEGLAEHKKGYGNLKEYLKLMTNSPAWAKGCPIKAEGWCGLRYHK